MRLRPSGWPDREAAQRLLDGSTPPAGQPVTGSGPDSLALLLAAVTAAPQPGELAGEDAALAAFRATVPSDVPARPPVVSRTRPNGAIAWIAGLATVATAGVAVAAGGLGGTDTPAPPPASTVPSRDATTGPTGPTGSADPTPTPVPTPSADSAHPTGRTSTELSDERALCAALLTKGSAERGRSLDSSAYRRLVADAGGRDEVDRYCRRLLETPPQNRQRPIPTPEHTAVQGTSTPPNQAVTQPTPGRR